MDEKQLVQITRRRKFAESEFWAMLNALERQLLEKFPLQQLSISDLSHKVSENFVTPKNSPIPDCLSCGGCCAFVFAIGVGLADQTPEENVWTVSVTTRNGVEIVVDRFLRRDSETGFCSGLEITSSAEKVCRIYEHRPATCRKFEAGSDRCHAIRRFYGYEPPLTLTEMFEAMQIIKKKELEPKLPAKIRDVKIIEQAETNELTFIALMSDRSECAIGTFIPNGESWRQIEFCGMTIGEAKILLAEKIGQI